MYSLILVDYNSLEKTIEYTNSCRENIGLRGAGHVVIVENGSQPGEMEALTAAFGPGTPWDSWKEARPVYRFEFQGQQILYCNSGENLGYARGNNLGARIARLAWEDPFYIVSNNDLVFEKPLNLTAVEQIFRDHPDAGVIGPRVTTPAGVVQSPRVWQSAFRNLVLQYWISAFGSLLGQKKREKLWNKHCADTDLEAVTGPCDWVTGCFVFLRAAAFHTIDMYDTHTFLYGEEMILSRRMSMEGFSTWFCREAEVIHKHGQTTKKSISILRGARLGFQSNCYFYEQYLGTPGWMLTLAKGSFRVYAWLYALKNRGSR